MPPSAIRFPKTRCGSLPLQTRNVVELLSLQPGVTSDGEVLGARRDQNNITLDGVDVNNNQNSGLVAQNTATGTGGYPGIERQWRRPSTPASTPCCRFRSIRCRSSA